MHHAIMLMLDGRSVAKNLPCVHFTNGSTNWGNEMLNTKGCHLQSEYWMVRFPLFCKFDICILFEYA